MGCPVFFLATSIPMLINKLPDCVVAAKVVAYLNFALLYRHPCTLFASGSSSSAYPKKSSNLIKLFVARACVRGSSYGADNSSHYCCTKVKAPLAASVQRPNKAKL